MPKSPTLSPRLNVEIEIVHQGRSTRYDSLILDLNSEVVCLKLPVEGGKPARLSPKASINVYVKAQGGLWHFSAPVLSTHLTPLPLVLVPRPAELTRVERREFARVDVKIVPMHFMLIDRTRDRGYGLQVIIRNVSGGGLMFTSSHRMQVGAELKMMFELPRGFGEITALGTVVHGRQAREFGNGIRAFGVAFTRISTAHREAIIRFTLRYPAGIV